MKNISLSVVALIACALSFVYAANTSEHDLSSLPGARGWVYTEIDDPWTVRPIGVDGKIPSDAEMDDIIHSYSSIFSPDSFSGKMAEQSQMDRSGKRCGAARSAAHYERNGTAFNVVVERLPDCSSQTGSTPIEAYLIVVTRQLATVADIMTGRAAIERFKLMIPHTTIAGVEFRTLPAALRSSQVASKDAELNIEGFVGNSIVRIWGVGDNDDVEDLLHSLNVSLQRYAGE